MEGLESTRVWGFERKRFPRMYFIYGQQILYFAYIGALIDLSAPLEVLGELLATTDRVVQEIDSVEYGLTDIQEYAHLIRV